MEKYSLVKRTCKELGITQKELSVYFGVTPKAVSDWSKGRYEVPKNFNIIIELIKSKEEFEKLKINLNK